MAWVDDAGWTAGVREFPVANTQRPTHTRNAASEYMYTLVSARVLARDAHHELDLFKLIALRLFDLRKLARWRRLRCGQTWAVPCPCTEAASGAGLYGVSANAMQHTCRSAAPFSTGARTLSRPPRTLFDGALGLLRTAVRLSLVVVPLLDFVRVDAVEPGHPFRLGAIFTFRGLQRGVALL
jgi:hypothetical protein